MAMLLKRSNAGAPLPRSFLEWQVRLRAWTMEARNGSPHVGVAPLVAVGSGAAGRTIHSIICGLLPRPDQVQAKTEAFRALYDRHAPDGARVLYDAGLDYLRGYYVSADDFDDSSITTLLPEDAPLARALGRDAACALVFYVFELDDTSEERRMRCLQLECAAELHASGPLYDNVWWHNALFHGKVSDHVMVRFKHLRTYDTRFGAFETVED